MKNELKCCDKLDQYCFHCLLKYSSSSNIFGQILNLVCNFAILPLAAIPLFGTQLANGKAARKCLSVEYLNLLFSPGTSLVQMILGL